MTQHSEPAVTSVSTAAPASVARTRRGSLAVLALILAEYGTGMYINLYVTVPPADRGHDLGSFITNGPAVLSIHIAIGLLLALGAAGVLAQAAMTRHLPAIAASVAGLFTLALADSSGASFTSTGHPAGDMAMSVLTGASVVCYAISFCAVRAPVEDAASAGAGPSAAPARTGVTRRAGR